MSGNHHNFLIYSLTDGLTSLAQDTEAKPPCAIMLPISTFDALAHWPFIHFGSKATWGLVEGAKAVPLSKAYIQVPCPFL